MRNIPKKLLFERLTDTYWWIRESEFNDPRKWDYYASSLKKTRNIFNFNLPENATGPEFLRQYIEACTELKFEAVDSSIVHELFAIKSKPKPPTKVTKLHAVN